MSVFPKQLINHFQGTNKVAYKLNSPGYMGENKTKRLYIQWKEVKPQLGEQMPFMFRNG